MMSDNYIYDQDMEWFPFEWDDPPQWLDWINNQFLEVDYHVQSGTFEKCLNVVQSHLHNWVTAGTWLYAIRRVKAYCHHYPNWKAFCEKALGRSVFTVRNYIKAARVFKDLAATGFKILPKNVSQCLPLSKLRGYELTEAWQKVIDENPPHLITNKVVEASVKGEPLKAEKRVNIPMDEWDKFRHRCREAGKDPNEELGKILDKYDPETGEMDEKDDLDDDQVEPVDPEKMEEWQEDVQDLMKWHEGMSDQAVYASLLISFLLDKYAYILPNPPE